MNKQTCHLTALKFCVPRTVITGGQELFPLTPCVQQENAIIALLCWIFCKPHPSHCPSLETWVLRPISISLKLLYFHLHASNLHGTLPQQPLDFFISQRFDLFYYVCKCFSWIYKCISGMPWPQKQEEAEGFSRNGFDWTATGTGN